MYFFEKYNVLFVRFFFGLLRVFFHRFFDRFSGGNFRRFFERFPGVFYRRFRTFFSGFKRLYIDVYFEKYSPFFKHCYGSISEAYFAWKIATKKSFCVAENRFFFRSIWCRKLCCNDTYVHLHFFLFTYLK